MADGPHGRRFLVRSAGRASGTAAATVSIEQTWEFFLSAWWLASLSLSCSPCVVCREQRSVSPASEGCLSASPRARLERHVESLCHGSIGAVSCTRRLLSSRPIAASLRPLAGIAHRDIRTPQRRSWGGRSLLPWRASNQAQRLPQLHSCTCTCEISATAAPVCTLQSQPASVAPGQDWH